MLLQQGVVVWTWVLIRAAAYVQMLMYCLVYPRTVSTLLVISDYVPLLSFRRSLCTVLAVVHRVSFVLDCWQGSRRRKLQKVTHTSLTTHRNLKS